MSVSGDFSQDPTSVPDISGEPAGGDSEEISYDFSAFEPTEEITSQPAGEQKNVSSDEGFYKNVLTEDIPEIFRNQLLPKLQEIDKGVNSRFREINEGWAPFKEFRENNVSVEDLRAAHNFATRFTSNPLEFFNTVRQALIEQGVLAQEQSQDNSVEEEDESLLTPTERQLRELQQQVEQQKAEAEAYRQQQIEAQQREAHEQTARQVYSSLQAELNQLEASTGKLPQALKQELFGRIQFMEQQMGRRVSLREAYTNMMEFGARLAGSKKSAPKIMSQQNGFGNAVNQQEFSSSDQRQQAAVELMARLNNR